MSTQSVVPAASNAVYPPDFRTVAEQEFQRLLKRAHPHASLDLDHAWLTSYTLKNLNIPPFARLPQERRPTVERWVRRFLRSEPARDTPLQYLLGLWSFDPTVHTCFYRAPDTVAEHQEIQPLESQHIRDLYENFSSALEPAYRQQLGEYWTYTHNGTSRRELFIKERRKALLLESEAAVEQGLLTTSQHAMLDEVLTGPSSAENHSVHKYGVFTLALADGQGSAQVLPGAFVITHVQSLQPPALNDSSFGEVLLCTEHFGLEGFENITNMIHLLNTRFNEQTQKQLLLGNLSSDRRENILNVTSPVPDWRLSVLSGDVLQNVFDQQLARQQADFSHLLRQARTLKTSAEDFVRTLPLKLTQAAHLDNAFMLDRNDQRLISRDMPHWWSTTSEDHQQHWVDSAQQYAQSIIQLHNRCRDITDDPKDPALDHSGWFDDVKRLIIAQLRMDQVQAQADRLPDAARAWMKAIIDSPCSKDREQVDGKPVCLDFMTLQQHALADVMRIAPLDSQADQPLLLCTLNAPDSRVFRWYPNEKTMHVQFLESPAFARYLLRQLPEASRPVECSAEQYELWLKYDRAGDTYKHLKEPARLPSFTFGEPDYLEEGENFLSTHHDLKHKRRSELRFRPEVIKKQGSLLGGVALNVAMLFIPSPVLITMALGVGLFKLWGAFQHIREGDYRGAAFELLCASGYLAAAALGRWSINRQPFAELESLRAYPPLVRQAAAEGEEQIGYLRYSDSMPQHPEPRLVPYDADQFRAIQIGDQHYFIKRQPWLFGHCQLYRADVENPNLLIAEKDYAVEAAPGVWSKVAAMRTKMSNWLFKRSDLELGGLTQNWPDSIGQISPAAKSDFERNYLRLAQTSNTDELPEIEDYCEGGSQPINSLLRAGKRTPWTQRVLNEFYRLHEYQGVAYRAVMVSPEGLRRLTSGIGEVFVDNGIQSASITRWNTEQWSREEFIRQTGSAENSTVYVIFDKSVAKKNLYTNFLGDHVAIAPSTPLQLVASRLVGKRFYIYFKRPMAPAQKMFDLYSGNSELML